MSKRTHLGLFSLVDHLKDPVTGLATSPTARLLEVVEQGVLAEQLGFERFAVGEHHFCDYILPNPNLVLAAIAARTSRIRLFTTVTLLALRDQLQLAEDVAVLDNLSQGRIELSLARGVSEKAGAAFGVPMADVYQVMALKLRELIHTLTSGEVRSCRDGEAKDARPLRLTPFTVQRPHPPLWIGGGLHVESCDLAVEHGLPLILPSLYRHPEDYLPMVDRYRSRMTELGKEDRIVVGMPNFCWVAPSSQQARAAWRPRIESYVQFSKQWRGGLGRAVDFETLLKGPAVCGSPAEVVDRLGYINELLGLNHHILLMDVGGVPFPELQDAMGLLGSDVLPQLS